VAFSLCSACYRSPAILLALSILGCTHHVCITATLHSRCMCLHVSSSLQRPDGFLPMTSYSMSHASSLLALACMQANLNSSGHVFITASAGSFTQEQSVRMAVAPAAALSRMNTTWTQSLVLTCSDCPCNRPAHGLPIQAVNAM